MRGTLPQEGPSTHNKRNSGMDHIKPCMTTYKLSPCQLSEIMFDAGDDNLSLAGLGPFS